MRRIAWTLAAGLLALPALAAEPDPFYTDLERDGRAALGRGDAVEAARLLRIACFGQLDAPDRLAGCLVRLAIAQGRSRDGEGFRETWGRLDTVHDRFSSLGGRGVEPAELDELARLAAERLAPDALALIPEIAARAPAPEPAPETRAERRARERQAAAAAPPDEEAAAAGTEDAPPPAAARSMEIGIADDAPSEPPADAPLTDAEFATVAAAREILAGRPTLEELSAALAALEPISESRPLDVELARLCGRMAYRASLWSRCAAAYRRAGDPGPDEPLERFYMAVCLYETGARDRAAEILHGSADRLTATPFVAAYLDRILGGREDGSP